MQIIDIKQGEHDWHLLRQGKVTGTALQSALGTKKVQETLLYRLVAERMTEVQIDDISSASVDRGNALEPIARRVVIAETGIEFVETGMLVSDHIADFGLSPDAVYYEDGVVVGGLEIKCPGSKKHVEYLLNNALPKEYLHQVKAPFILDDSVRWWYFASFDDRNYERSLFLIKMMREDFDDIDADRAKLSEFLESVNHAHLALTF